MGSTAKVFADVNPNLWVGRPASAQNVVPDLPAHLPFGPGQLRIYGAQVTNAATASAVGLGVVLSDDQWVFGKWVNATTTFTDDTANAQSGTSNAVVLVTTTTNNGFVIGALTPFNMFSLDITTADAGGSPAYDFAYWGYPTTGSKASAATWQTVSANLIAAVLTATGEAIAVLNIPKRVMVATTAAVGVTGFPIGYYAVRVRATTKADNTAAKLARVYPGVEMARSVQLAQYGQMNLAGGVGSGARSLSIPGGVMLGAFFGTANASNHMYLEYE